jgi:hypothetical protein
LDAAVLEHLRHHIDMMINFEQFTEGLVQSETHSQRRTELTRDRAKWEKAVTDADKTLSSAYTHHLDGLLDYRELEVIRAKIERDKRDATAKMERAASELKKYNDMAARHRQWRKTYADFTTAEATTKELVQLLVDRIELTPLTNELHIIMHYENGLDEYRGLLTESGVSAYA